MINKPLARRRELAIDVAGSLRSPRVIEVLAQLVSVHGAPTHLRSACYELLVKPVNALMPAPLGGPIE